jgi:hypothetical protein
MAPVRGRTFLKAGGWLFAAVALLHFVVPFVGARAYRYFGAGEAMARRAEAGSLEPAVMTFILAGVFAAFSYYAFAGAGSVRRPPLLRTGLIAIGAIATLRGVAFFPEAAHHLQHVATQPLRWAAFSFAALVIGLLYLIGTVGAWPDLRPTRPGQSG